MAPNNRNALDAATSTTGIMTQLIASYELAIGCECTATLYPYLPSSVRAFFLPGENHERHYPIDAQQVGIRRSSNGYHWPDKERDQVRTHKFMDGGSRVSSLFWRLPAKGELPYSLQPT